MVFVKFLELSFGSNILPSFTEFQCQGTDSSSFIWLHTFEVHIKVNFCISNRMFSRGINDKFDEW